MQIYVPTTSPEQWKALLAQPDRHWKAGYSAMALARCWEEYKPRGFPPEIGRVLGTFCDPVFAIPEYKTDLPGGDRPSQSDLFVLAEQAEGLVTIMIEGKVNETFGPTLDERRADASPGVQKRIAFLLETLKLPPNIPGTIRYQLLHRAASAVLAQRQFNAYAAAMIVHSFSQTGAWFDDFAAFLKLFGVDAKPGELCPAYTSHHDDLWFAWCQGEARFLEP